MATRDCQAHLSKRSYSMSLLQHKIQHIELSGPKRNQVIHKNLTFVCGELEQHGPALCRAGSPFHEGDASHTLRRHHRSRRREKKNPSKRGSENPRRKVRCELYVSEGVRPRKCKKHVHTQAGRLLTAHRMGHYHRHPLHRNRRQLPRCPLPRP
ncbi:hypothetical protein EDB89DRAFT_2000864, partial [Lactarius sanguifluus]